MKKWFRQKLFIATGALTASIPTFDLYQGGFGLDEIYGFIIAAIVTWLTKIGIKIND